MNAAVLKSDRQDILVLPSIFAEAGKPWLSVKPRLVGGELHFNRLVPARKVFDFVVAMVTLSAFVKFVNG
jgi:hypothetical protein